MPPVASLNLLYLLLCWHLAVCINVVVVWFHCGCSVAWDAVSKQWWIYKLLLAIDLQLFQVTYDVF